jgi:hypothetical protein
LTASPAVLHGALVSLLSESPDIPLDVFDKIEIVREERYCVPAYCFDCNATASFTYEAGSEHRNKTAVDLGDRTRVETDYYTVWNHGSSNASITATYFVSGNKKMAAQIEKLCSHGIDPKQLIDVNELNFPSDAETYEYNLPELAAFNEYVKPYIEKELESKAENSVKDSYVRGLKMGGSNIQKEMLRVFLGIYHVVYKYGDQEYSMWVTGDGKTYCHDGLPMDLERKNEYQLKVKKAAYARAARDGYDGEIKKTISVAEIVVAIIIWVGSILVMSALDMESSKFVLGVISVTLFIALCSLPDIFRIMKNKRIQAEQDEYDESVIDAETDLKNFEAQLPNAIRQFKAQKKALRGIYENVTGDPSAF